MRIRIGGACVALVWLASVAAGDTIVGVTFGNSGDAYWNNPSKDASSPSICGNIGCLLENIYGTTGTANPANLSWGTASGSPGDFTFNSQGNGFTITALQNSTLNGITFGWYDTTTGDKHVIFTSPNGVPACATPGDPGCAAQPSWTPAQLTFATSYGFYVTVDYHNGITDTYYTQASTNTSDGVAFDQVGSQHFVIFQKDGKYYLGVEDTLFYDRTGGENTRTLLSASASGNLDNVEGSGDFQDLVLLLDPGPINPVPEPATIGPDGSRARRLGTCPPPSLTSKTVAQIKPASAPVTEAGFFLFRQ